MHNDSAREGQSGGLKSPQLPDHSPPGRGGLSPFGETKTRGRVRGAARAALADLCLLLELRCSELLTKEEPPKAAAAALLRDLSTFRKVYC